MSGTDFGDGDLEEGSTLPQVVQWLASQVAQHAEAIRSMNEALYERDNSQAVMKVAYHAAVGAELAARIAHLASDDEAGWQDVHRWWDEEVIPSSWEAFDSTSAELRAEDPWPEEREDGGPEERGPATDWDEAAEAREREEEAARERENEGVDESVVGEEPGQMLDPEARTAFAAVSRDDPWRAAYKAAESALRQIAQGEAADPASIARAALEHETPLEA